MDSTTFQQLAAAFTAAPSVELALVLCRNTEQPEDTIDRLNQLLTLAQRLAVAEALSQGDDAAEWHPQVLALLDSAAPEHQLLRYQTLLAQGRETEAREDYLRRAKQDASVRQPQVEKLLQFQDQLPQEKVRLKVVEKSDPKEVTDLNTYRQEVTTFRDVVGLEAIKKQINRKIILPFQKPSLYQRFRKKIGGGVLLFGPPGCGKTLLARATAGECQASFYNVELSDVLDMYIGESEQKLHAIFEKARAETPSVLFFDEFEALASKRESSRNSSFNHLVSQFLNELDGFAQQNSGVLVLASTNVPWSVDSAFLRPGRFDRMFFVPPPDRTAREGILRHHMRERPAVADIRYDQLALKTRGYSGADLYNLVEMAADEAIEESIEREEDISITHAHFKNVLREANPTTVEWLTTARNYARYANDGGRYNDVLKFIQQHGK